MKNFKRFLPIMLLIISLIIFFSLNGQQYLSLDIVKEHYNSLLIWSDNNFWLSSIIFISTYIAIVAISIPGAIIMTLLGGFLFGIFTGVLWILIAATIGSCLVFLSVKLAFGKFLKSKASGSVEKLRKGFENNAFNYLLTLRLIPIFPFFIINIAYGALGIRLSTFFRGTLLVIIPGTVIYAWVELVWDMH